MEQITKQITKHAYHNLFLIFIITIKLEHFFIWLLILIYCKQYLITHVQSVSSLSIRVVQKC